MKVQVVAVIFDRAFIGLMRYQIHYVGQYQYNTECGLAIPGPPPGMMERPTGRTPQATNTASSHLHSISDLDRVHTQCLPHEH
jgi:hypothetical protein